MKQYTSILLCILFSIAIPIKAQDIFSSKKWEFNVIDAPYGYEKGQLEFKTTEGVLNGIIHIQGYTYSIKNIKQEEDFYTCKFYLDGSLINATLKPVEDKLTAKVTFDGIALDVNFKEIVIE